MNEASPGTRSLTLNPRPSVKNRCDASWSSEPTTTCPSLRGWTRLVPSMARARPPRVAREPPPEPARARLDPAQVGGIVGADRDLQQPAPLGRPHRQLLA